MSSHMSSQSFDSTSTRSAWVPPLLWKEFRQVVPLITAVLLGGFGLLLLILVLSALESKKSFSFDRGYWYLFLSMPMMYATGVGVLLVGIEKESRSLQWMRSLPISSKQIAWNKLVVAMGTLALVWLIALTAWCAFASAVGGDPRALDPWVPGQSDSAGWLLATYFLLSLFLSLAGLAFAWRFQSQFLSLALLVPAALALWLPAYGLANYLSNKNYSLETQIFIDAGLYLLSLAIGCVGFLAYGWRVSQRELAALEPPVGTSGVTSLVRAASASESRSSEAWMLWPRVSPITGMLWQMVRQNGIWWIAYAALGVVLVVLCSSLSLLSGPTRTDTVIGLLYIPMAILSGWLGILAYHSDGIQQRVRFYADRGVSPTLYWCTRHWMPVTLMLGLCLVRYLTNFGTLKTPLNLVDSLGLLAILLASYCVGQWVSQFVKSPTIAAISAPMALLAMVAYGLFAIVGMESPWWLLFATFGILAVSTVWMMRPWMERRIDWKYYLQHSGFLVVALTIPLLPGLWKIWNTHGISKELRANLNQLALSNPHTQENHSRPSFETGLESAGLSAGVDGDIGKIQARLERNEQVRAYYPQELIDQASRSAFWQSYRDPEALLRMYIAELARLRSEIRAESQSTTEPADKQFQTAMSYYQKILAGVPKLVRELRATHALKDSDLAERIEIVALSHCLDPTASESMGKAVFEPLVELLTDDSARDESRRIALANAWREQFRSFGSDAIAYGENQFQAYFGSIPSSIQMLYSRDRFVSDLWKLLQSKSASAESISQRENIRSKSYYDYAGPTDLIDGTILLGLPSNMPAKSWRGNWELLTKQLRPEAKDHE
ncbi:MAG: hypothetical protein NTV29_10340 [Planctomycetota bacterium]|nr:hypothetical protein [Planctomycetota bacterium]